MYIYIYIYVYTYIYIYIAYPDVYLSYVGVYSLYFIHIQCILDISVNFPNVFFRILTHVNVSFWRIWHVLYCHPFDAFECILQYIQRILRYRSRYLNSCIMSNQSKSYKVTSNYGKPRETISNHGNNIVKPYKVGFHGCVSKNRLDQTSLDWLILYSRQD